MTCTEEPVACCSFCDCELYVKELRVRDGVLACERCALPARMPKAGDA